MERLDKLSSSSSSSTREGGGQTGVVTDSQWQTTVWGGKFRFLPENHVIKQMNVKSAWDSWLFGSRADGVPPYRMIDVDDFKL